MSAATLSSSFARDGLVVIEGVLRGAALDSFRAQVSAELTAPCIPPESGTPRGVALSAPSTWPKGGGGRVEVGGCRGYKELGLKVKKGLESSLGSQGRDVLGSWSSGFGNRVWDSRLRV
jgi:hypothetical protein